MGVGWLVTPLQIKRLMGSIILSISVKGMYCSFWRFVINENFPSKHFHLVSATIMVEDFHVRAYVLLPNHLDDGLLAKFDKPMLRLRGIQAISPAEQTLVSLTMRKRMFPLMTQMAFSSPCQ